MDPTVLLREHALLVVLAFPLICAAVVSFTAVRYGQPERPDNIQKGGDWQWPAR